MTKKYDVVLGIDYGNGLVNIYSSKDGEIYSETLPSSFILKGDYGSQFAFSNDESDLDLYSYNGGEYLWGNDIEKQPVIDTFGHENRYKSIPFITITQLAIAKAVRDLEIQPTDKILVVTGVPTAEKGNKAIEVSLADAIKNSKTGLNKVAINDEEYIYNVEDVMIMPQALSSVFGIYYDEEGMVAESKYEDMKVAVIDIGGGTIDIDIIKNLRRLDVYESMALGFRDVYDGIRKYIKKFEPKANPNDYDLYKIINDNDNIRLNTFAYKPSAIRDSIDFTEEFYRQLDKVTMELHQLIMTKWKAQVDLDEILLVGGSAKFFKDRVKNIVEGFVVPNNCGITNAVGYHNYGKAFVNSL